MRFQYAICFALVAVLSVHARTWTRPDGKTVDAEIVKVNKNRTVVLRTGRGKTVTVPFNTFVEADVKYLESRLSGNPEQGPLDAVPWNRLNDIFGIPIWQDANLWDDATAATAERLKMRTESKTAFMENYRSYPLGRKNMLGQPLYAAALYGGKTKTESLSFIFLNLGDIPPNTNPNRIEKLIKVTGEQMRDVLQGVLGEPGRDSLGTGDLREKVWRWDWNGHAIMLSIQEGKYTALRIMPVERADNGGKIAGLSDDALKARMAANVERRKNGDVIIHNIPMIDQGPKGYCSPATWERYLRYVDIPADMYLLALAANTGIGGGTYSADIIKATGNIISSNGRKLGKAGDKPAVSKISKFIDKGMPVMWSFTSTPSFQLEASNNTARRNGKEVRKKNTAGQAEDTQGGGHICLIIGYNKTTDEIAISDSWGPRFTERWVPAKSAQALSYGTLNVIKW